MGFNRAGTGTLRASRPQGPAIHTANHAIPTCNAIEAALCLSAKMPEAKVLNWYGDKTVETAQSRDMHSMGLHELFHMVIQAAGSFAHPGRMSEDTIRTAFYADRTLRASGGSFSTISLSGILSNVADKALLESYTAVESIATQIYRTQSDVNDFKQVTRRIIA